MLLARPSERIDEDKFSIHASVVVSVWGCRELQDASFTPYEVRLEGLPSRSTYMVSFVNEQVGYVVRNPILQLNRQARQRLHSRYYYLSAAEECINIVARLRRVLEHRYDGVTCTIR
jgi:hypothetical protein